MTFVLLGVLFLVVAVFLFLFPFERAKKGVTELLTRDLTELAEEAGVEVDVERFTLIRLSALVFSLVLAVLLVYLYGPLFAAAALAVALAAFRLTRQGVAKLREARARAIAREFPFFVSQLVVFMRISDVYHAIEAASKSLQGPLGEELRRLREELSYLPLRAALRNFARRVRYEPAQAFVTTLLYGITTGADVLPILESYAKRAYAEYVNNLKRRVRSQPVWLSFLPVGLGFFILLVIVYPLFMDVMTRLNFS